MTKLEKETSNKKIAVNEIFCIPSNQAVERIFSRVKFVVDSHGRNMLVGFNILTDFQLNFLKFLRLLTLSNAHAQNTIIWMNGFGWNLIQLN